MAKSLQIIITSIILIMLLFMQSIFVFAEVRIEKSNKVPSAAIEIEKDFSGSLRQFTYTTSATGATSGIRYRFTEINLNIGGLEFSLDTRNIVGAKPPAGKTEYYDITITKNDIIEGVKEQLGRELTASEIQKLEQGFKNPGQIDIGATIEIYNADTGKVLDELTSVDEIYDRASKYGFPKRNLDDMASRFKGNPSTPTPQPPTPGPENIPNTGLRPTGIRDKSIDD